jgi:hypothetical protein
VSELNHRNAFIDQFDEVDKPLLRRLWRDMCRNQICGAPKLFVNEVEALSESRIECLVAGQVGQKQPGRDVLAQVVAEFHPSLVVVRLDLHVNHVSPTALIPRTSRYLLHVDTATAPV